MRQPTFVVIFFLSGFMAIFFTFIDASMRQHSAMDGLNSRAELVKELGLSDLALFTEARYTRSLSLADRHSAFQDHPSSFDHFPSDSFYLPPEQLKQ